MKGNLNDGEKAIEAVYYRASREIAPSAGKVGYHSRYVMEKYGDRLPYRLKGHEEAFALLYSTIGYNPDRVKRAMVRQTKLGKDKQVMLNTEKSTWKLFSYRGKELKSGRFEHFGEFLGKEYWRIDFSDIREEGEGFYIEADIKTANGVFDVVLRSEPFDINKNLFTKRTIYGVAVANFDERKIVHHLNPLGDPFLGGAWIDCNANMSEVRHIPWVIYGCADLLASHGDYLGPMVCEALYENIRWGLDHIADLQWQDGMFIDQHPDRNFGEWAHQTLDQNFYSPIALCAGYQVFKEKDAERAKRYLEAAIRGYNWVLDKGRNLELATYGVSTTSGPTHIIDKENATWTVGDHSDMVWLETKLYECTGDEKYILSAKESAKKVLGLQITDPKDALKGLYGDFYLRSGSKVRATEVYERPAVSLHGLLALIRLMPNDADHEKWKSAIRTYAYNYLKPACALNPFGITPVSVEGDEPIYLRPNGRNPVVLQMAIQYLALASLFEDDDFLNLATNHIQWIAGLHHGIPGTFTQPESYLEAVPASFINCVGSHFALQHKHPFKAAAHHGPGGLVYWVNWRDNKRQYWTKQYPHAFPTLIMGLCSGEISMTMFDDYYTNEQSHCSETLISPDGLWLMTISRYEKTPK